MTTIQAYDNVLAKYAKGAGFEHACTPDSAKLYCGDTVPANLADLVAAEITRLGVINQIAAIEASITPRREREARLGTDNGWLAARDAEIAALKNTLT